MLLSASSPLSLYTLATHLWTWTASSNNSSARHLMAEAWVTPLPSRFPRRGFPSWRLDSTSQPNILDDLKNPIQEYDPSSFTPKKPLDLRILLIDNHDSYTYNLYQYLSTMTTHPVKVVMNDDFSTWDALMHNMSAGFNNTKEFVGQAGHAYRHFDCIIISPGPGRPSHASDMGIVLETIKRNPDVPILGVCLGHQALGYVYGCDVTLAPCGPVHGLMSTVFYDQERDHKDINQLFNGIPQYFDVVRYHSLVVQFPESDELDVESIAWCNAGVSAISDHAKTQPQDRIDSVQTKSQPDQTELICMGLRHKIYPHYGVQFHPESVGTGENGYTLMHNFCDLAYQFSKVKKLELGIESIDLAHDSSEVNGGATSRSDGTLSNHDDILSESSYKVIIHKIDRLNNTTSFPTPEQVYEEVYGTRHNSFWLDSSTGKTKMKSNGAVRSSRETQLEDGDDCPITSISRFSIMGTDDGPSRRIIEYFGREHSPEVRGLYVTSKEKTEVFETDVLTYLRKQLAKEQQLTRGVNMVAFSPNSDDFDIFEDSDNAVPFEYRGGYVGYLGYEVRYDCLDDGCRGEHCAVFDPDNTNPRVPSAAFLFADQSLVYDHHLDEWYAIGVAADEETTMGNILSWVREISNTITSIGKNRIIESDGTIYGKSKQSPAVAFTPNRSKEQHCMDVNRSHDEIRKGESYELCVTNQFTANIGLPKHPQKQIHETPLELYKRLRRRNPAPFSSFFNLYPQKSISGGTKSAKVSICCSSPERFLCMRKAAGFQDTYEFIIESKPIKGTASRYRSEGSNEDHEFVEKADSEIASMLKASVKDRAENLMIVDLLRNDFGRVCKIGSVHVPKLMHIESYATVHQMVSTVRGKVDGRSTNAIDVIEACFPGGSMTGAPKHRTVEILDEIECGVSRGPYSGCMGYISLNGCMDLNIIIRTAVLTPSEDINESTEAWRVSIGSGGAITALSNSNDEYDEMLLKSRAVREAVCEWIQSRTA